METNLEIEYKFLLSKQQYDKLKELYYKDVKPFSQTNHYFQDKKGLLRKHLYSLRCRFIDQKIEFTLKKPSGFSKIEMNEYLSLEDYEKLKNHQAINSRILDELKEIDVDVKDLEIITSLTTLRYEIDYQGGHLALDKNDYNQITDYELEYEATSQEQGLVVFNDILGQINEVYKQNNVGKLTRALNSLQ